MSIQPQREELWNPSLWFILFEVCIVPETRHFAHSCVAYLQQDNKAISSCVVIMQLQCHVFLRSWWKVEMHTWLEAGSSEVYLDSTPGLFSLSFYSKCQTPACFQLCLLQLIPSSWRNTFLLICISKHCAHFTKFEIPGCTRSTIATISIWRAEAPSLHFLLLLVALLLQIKRSITVFGHAGLQYLLYGCCFRSSSVTSEAGADISQTQSVGPVIPNSCRPGRSRPAFALLLCGV